MEIDDRFAEEHIQRWTTAWNDHNINEVLSLYSEDILFSSPKVKSVYPNQTSATITNRKDLEEYFCSGAHSLNYPFNEKYILLKILYAIMISSQMAAWKTKLTMSLTVCGILITTLNS